MRVPLVPDPPRAGRPARARPAPAARFELPEELRIDTDVARRVIAGFIRGQLRQAGFERAVLGLSGGIDSALVAYLVAEAIGTARLLCVMMPYRTSRPRRRAMPRRWSGAWDAEPGRRDHRDRRRRTSARTGDVGAAPSPGAGGPEALAASALRRGNFMARARMMVLYDASVTWGGLVVGTGNKTEALIGYTTLFGDSACAFNPIGDLYKSQVRQLSLAMGVPTPSFARRRRPTSGRARRTRRRRASPTTSSTASCTR